MYIMNDFEKELLKFWGEEKLSRIQRVRVGIAGAGGLGSNCALFLVRSGFRNFKIYDFDKLAYSNLNRQFYFYDQVGEYKVDALKVNLLRINPDLNLEIFRDEITYDNVSGIFKDCDIVIEAFDKAECKKMLAETYMRSGKLYITATGLAGWGDSDEIHIRKITETFFMVGDFSSESSPDNPPFAPRVNIAAAKEADIALEWTLKNKF